MFELSLPTLMHFDRYLLIFLFIYNYYFLVLITSTHVFENDEYDDECDLLHSHLTPAMNDIIWSLLNKII